MFRWPALAFVLWVLLGPFPGTNKVVRENPFLRVPSWHFPAGGGLGCA